MRLISIETFQRLSYYKHIKAVLCVQFQTRIRLEEFYCHM